MSGAPSLADLALKAEIAVHSLDDFRHLLSALSSANQLIEPGALNPVEECFARHLEVATEAVAELRAAIRGPAAASGQPPG